MRTLTRSQIQSRICAATAICGGIAALGMGRLPVLLEKTASFSAGLLYGEVAVNEDMPPDEPSEDIVCAAAVGEEPSDAVYDDLLSYGLVPSCADEDPKPFPPLKDIESVLPQDNESGGEVTEIFIGHCTGSEYIDLKNGGQVRNLTSEDNSGLLMLSEGDIFTFDDISQPTVLIMHTHATECYEDDAVNGYYRTTDKERNVCAVGERIAGKLRENGIGVIHDTTLHDHPSYNGAYDRSRETIERILSENPTIRIVLDIHRDAMERDGERLAPVTVINGRKAAQVMIICGCDDGTMGMPRCKENFGFACALQSIMEHDAPT
ncbi:MAG: stage II sporulation protein P, partial [Oscillospiraceae bacterium]|nr:stage II sporulation protein P [Oscillospiraceae bacterium]